VIEAEKNEEAPSWGEVFSNATKTRNLHRVVLGMGPYMMNQWSRVSKLNSKSSRNPILAHTNLVRALGKCTLLLPCLYPR
jgi:hypothetical protein